MALANESSRLSERGGGGVVWRGEDFPKLQAQLPDLGNVLFREVPLRTPQFGIDGGEKGSETLDVHEPILARHDLARVHEVDCKLYRIVRVMREIHLTPYKASSTLP